MSKSPRDSILVGDLTNLSLVKDSPIPSQAITQAATTPKHQREASRRRTIFTNDQEIFVDTQMPLILLSDTNLGLHFPNSTALTRVVSTKGSYMRHMETTTQPTQSQSPPSKKLEPLDVSENSHSEAFKTPKSVPHLTPLKKEASEKGSQGTSGMKESSHANDDLDIFNGNRIEIIEEMNPRKLFVKIVLNSKTYNVIYTFLVLYALFADDLRQILLDKRTDTLFDVFTFICLFAFSLEICLYWYVDKAYRWSLFFFLDFLSTASFIINLSFVSSTLLPSGTTNAAQLARASRASRIGTRAGRIVRLVRMFRISKIFEFLKLKNKKKDDMNKVFPTNSSQQSEIMKLENSGRINLEGSLNPTPRNSVFDFNLSSSRLPRSPSLRAGAGRTSMMLPRQNSLERVQDIHLDKPADENMMTPFKRARTMLQKVNEKQTDTEEAEHELKESRVGKKLSDLTTKRVVVIVLLMLVLLPMFSTTFFFEKNASDSYELSLLGKLLSSSSVSQTTKDKALAKYISQETKANPKLIKLTWGKTVKYEDPDVNIDRLRWDEQNKNTVKTSKGDLVSITNLRPDSVMESELSLGRNFFVIVVLATAALLFSKDANTLVLRPIERMIEKVNMIARNPLIAKNQQLVGEKNDGFENETVQIENAIVKIGGLLALGYGDAGSMIITKNVAESGDLNPMLAGRKIAAIFGFCDIRNFTDATEVLQEGVMVFVNSIAEIVHSTVDKYCGAANKNIGDAFLLAWKLPEDDLLEYEDGTLLINPSKTVTNLADLSLLSFLKINAKINKDPTLLEYRDNPSLCARLPKYKVKMGFGLHLGWAIEGAIGSQFKIDASYLSPNVNLASRLEAATKQYGVPLLFSGELYARLSKKMQQKTRLIDVVTVKGSVQPMEIYTCDMDVNDLIAGRDRRKMAKREREEKHYAQKELFEDMLYYGETAQILDMDKEIQHLLRHQDPIFNELFTLGFNGYVDGDWTMAKKKFEECLAIKNDDGPTRNLMAFLAESDFISPEDWKGFRVLTDK